MNRWQQQSIHYLSHFIKAIKPHINWLIALICCSAILICLNSSYGSIKPGNQWSWMDILGEGSICLFVALWLLIVLATRIPGCTTRWLASGLIGIYLACLQDFLDEIFTLKYSPYSWDSMLESLPVGLLILTVGLFFWYREQRQINTFLLKRADTFQSDTSLHSNTSFPKVSDLYKELESGQKEQQPFRLAIIGMKPGETEHMSLNHFEDCQNLRRHAADSVFHNIPGSVLCFQITRDHIALLCREHNPAHPIELQNLVVHLRSLRFYPAGSVVPYSLEVSVKEYTGTLPKNKSEIDKLLSDALCETKSHATAHNPNHKLGY